MPIKYACINDATTLVAEYPQALEQPKLADTLQKVVATIPPKEYRRKTIEDTNNGINYHYLANGEGRIVACAATSDVRMRVAFNFLEAVEPVVRGTTAADTKGFKKVLQQKLEFFNNPSNDKISALSKEIDEVKDVMMDNMDKIIARGDRIDSMQTQSAALAAQAETFHKRSVDLKRAFCLRNAKLTIMIVVAVIVVIIIIVLIACNPNFSKCKKS